MSKKKTKYEVRRWVSFPAFYTVEADSPLEAREQAYKLALAYVNSLQLQGANLEEGDSVVATVRTKTDPYGKVLLFKYETEVAK